MFKNALVSCSDKSGLADFLRPFVERGLRVVSTGGTAKYLKEHNIPVVDVSEQTHFPEVMDGRVKTLHPMVHMALLARSENPEDQKILKQNGLAPFDLVIGNLYPFENEPGIEMIDVGGPSFLRAAAKNHASVTVVCDPQDYVTIASAQNIDLDMRRRLAAKVFAHTASYDAMIAEHLQPSGVYEFNDHALGGQFVQKLRYGENPQQSAVWYRRKGQNAGLHRGQILQGKELSYNNILDLDAAVSTLCEFQDTNAFIAVKHNSPCGVSWGEKKQQVLKRGIAADPQSIFGGIVAVNFVIDEECAEELNKIFLECVIAPKFNAGALQIFSKKKNLRLIEYPEIQEVTGEYKLRTVLGGYLVQQQDRVSLKWQDDWKVIGGKLNDEQKFALLQAWRTCAHLKSNAIAIADEYGTVGLGMGQVNRVDSVEQALQRMRKFHPHCQNAVLASDAFFPFADSIGIIADANIKFVIQPGGSVRDEEVFAEATARGIHMVLTGTRHFLH